MDFKQFLQKCHRWGLLMLAFLSISSYFTIIFYSNRYHSRKVNLSSQLISQIQDKYSIYAFLCKKQPLVFYRLTMKSNVTPSVISLFIEVIKLIKTKCTIVNVYESSLEKDSIFLDLHNIINLDFFKAFSDAIFANCY